MKRCLWVALCLSAVVSVAAGAQRVSPPQPKQRQGLEYFEGTWRFTWTGRESPISPGPRTGTVTFAHASDGASLDMRTEGSSEAAGSYTERGTLEWNAATKTLTVRERLANNVDLVSTGDWSSPITIRSESAPVRAGAQEVRLRRVYGIVSAHSFTVAEEISVDGGAFVRLGGGVFSKAAVPKRLRLRATRAGEIHSSTDIARHASGVPAAHVGEQLEKGPDDREANEHAVERPSKIDVLTQPHLRRRGPRSQVRTSVAADRVWDATPRPECPDRSLGVGQATCRSRDRPTDSLAWRSADKTLFAHRSSPPTSWRAPYGIPFDTAACAICSSPTSRPA